MNGPLLVLGAGGQLGRTLVELAGARGTPATGLRRAVLDITDSDAVRRAIDATKPRLIVNAAAYTAVDKAESHEAEAVAGNVTGPAVLAAAATEAGLPLVHISTDYVFDGMASHALRESDPVAPIGVYGRTKAEGESAVRAALPAHFILRTAWVYSAYGNSFLKTMLRSRRRAGRAAGRCRSARQSDGNDRHCRGDSGRGQASGRRRWRSVRHLSFCRHWRHDMARLCQLPSSRRRRSITGRRPEGHADFSSTEFSDAGQTTRQFRARQFAFHGRTFGYKASTVAGSHPRNGRASSDVIEQGIN